MIPIGGGDDKRFVAPVRIPLPPPMDPPVWAGESTMPVVGPTPPPLYTQTVGWAPPPSPSSATENTAETTERVSDSWLYRVCIPPSLESLYPMRNAMAPTETPAQTWWRQQVTKAPPPQCAECRVKKRRTPCADCRAIEADIDRRLADALKEKFTVHCY